MSEDILHTQLIDEILPICNTEHEEKCISEILTWIKSENIKVHKEQVKYVLYFLRGTKFNLNKAKKKIKSYYKMREDRTEWFTARDPFLPLINDLLDLGVFLPLKQKSENRLVVVIRTGCHDPKLYSQNNVLKVSKMILDFVLAHDESISFYGVVAIFDMKGVTAGHAFQITPAIIKRSVESWENYPSKTKKLEFVNAPFYVNVVLNIFRSFMTTKMKSRMIVSKGACSIDERILPTDLNGSGESYKELAVYWKQKMQDNLEWFKEEANFQYVD